MLDYIVNQGILSAAWGCLGSWNIFFQCLGRSWKWCYYFFRIWFKGDCCSVTKLCLTLYSHGLHHTMFPHPSLSPEVCSNPRPLIWWCYPAIPFSVAPFSFPQSFPASGSFPISWLFASSDQSIEASASASLLPMNIQDWFPLGSTGLTSLLSNTQ